MSSWSKIFNCCEKLSYIKNKEVEMNTTNINKEEPINEEEYTKTDNKNKNNNIPLQNLLLTQSNSELYQNLLKNKINADSQNLSNQNIATNPDEYNIFPNKIINNNIINNNIIRITNNNNFFNMNQKESRNMSFFGQQNNIRKISANKKMKNLELSGNLFFNQKLIISQNGLRNKKEFPIFFGVEDIIDKNGIPYNDYIVNYTMKKKIKKKVTNNSKKEKNRGNIENDKNDKNEIIINKEDIKRGRLFEIIYDKNRNEYTLNFINESLLLYYKINNPIYFEYDKEYYFILGNVFLSVIVKEIDEKKNISIKIETEDLKARKANFENAKKLVIGRANTCDIEIERPNISKIHSIIEYDNDLNLYYYKDNKSTNGSTLLMREDDSITIKGCMYFKLENTFFIIKEIEK